MNLHEQVSGIFKNHSEYLLECKRLEVAESLCGAIDKADEVIINCLDKLIGKYPELITKPDPKLMKQIEELIEGVEV